MKHTCLHTLPNDGFLPFFVLDISPDCSAVCWEGDASGASFFFQSSHRKKHNAHFIDFWFFGGRGFWGHPVFATCLLRKRGLLVFVSGAGDFKIGLSRHSHGLCKPDDSTLEHLPISWLNLGSMWLYRSPRTAAHPHRDVHMLNVCVLWSLRQSVLQMALVTCGSWQDHVFGATDTSAASKVLIVTRDHEAAAFVLPETSDRKFSSGINQGGSFKNTGTQKPLEPRQGVVLVRGATPDASYGLTVPRRETKLLPRPGRKKWKTYFPPTKHPG